MAAKDKIHQAVKNALIKDGWTITDDPYTIRYEDVILYADLAAERAFAAKKGSQKIVVEVKSFLDPSPINNLKNALGQYDLYHRYLRIIAPDHTLYVALSESAYARLIEIKGLEVVLQDGSLPMLVINITTEEIVSWKN